LYAARVLPGRAPVVCAEELTMTRDKDRKRIIRSRMAKTGESYTTARARVVAKAHPRNPATPKIDYAARAGIGDEKIAAKTGRTWQEWTRVLDVANAATLPHRDIARIVHADYGVDGWWSQTVTVGYERIKGLREIGQRRGGAYEVGRSRTFNVPVNVLFDAWAGAAARRRWLKDVSAVVRTATRPKSIRLQWPDGTIVVAGFIAKGATKSVVAVQHTKLPDKAASQKAKDDWAERLDALGAVVSANKRG
jgi:hypothetical protein